MYWIYQAHQVRGLPAIEKRHYLAQFVLNICLAGVLFFSVPFSLIASALIFEENKLSDRDISQYHPTTKAAILIWDISFSICCYGDMVVVTYNSFQKKKKILYKIVVKNSVLPFGYFFKKIIMGHDRYYHLKQSQHLSHGEWVGYINQHQVEVYRLSNFFEKYKKTFGNEKWLVSRVVAPQFLIECICEFMLDFVIKPIWLQYIFRTLTLAISTTIVSVVWFKMPSYVDTIFLKREIKWLLYLILIVFISYTMYTICVIMDPQFRRLPRFGYLAIFDPIFSVLGFVAIMGHTIDQYKLLTLREILSAKNGLELFMNFLFQEFSYENLLGLIEFAQFRNFLLSVQMKELQAIGAMATLENVPKSGTLGAGLEEKNEDKADLKQLTMIVSVDMPMTVHSDDKIISSRISLDSSVFHIDLPLDIVQSEIVFDNTLTPNTKFKLLVEKYILNNGRFTLNVSDQNRLHLIRLYTQVIRPCHTHVQVDVDHCVFDACSLELYALMHDNFSRFKQSDVYIKYCKSVQ
ncbi:hypothetical protein RFI_06519 [Reticulomyxa filosa]|uniref:RGS domain-containing protein n=1 Tax=Reticulomyxa filosa TaxID=46433 RepID=X6NXQ3_RETFI|nr:hypothetical protein RFI_06519 [Reticulomyxa filosa]|eukprot:ETO30604.1 hypothetical protein RFI_06519 [Reticulomyxa filosa]